MGKKRKSGQENSLIKAIKAKEPYVTDDNKIVIPVQQGKTFSKQVQTLLSKYNNKLDTGTKNLLAKYANGLDVINQEVFSTFLDVDAMEKAGKGTSIPYISTLYGNFLINPCSVSISTFQKMWDTDDVIGRCTGLNVSTIVDGIGEFYHSNKKIQEFIRYSFTRLKGGKDELIRKILSSMWAGFWVGLVEDEVDKNGYTIIENVRHLPALSIQFTATAQGDVDETFQYVYNYPYAGTQNLLSIGFVADGFDGGNRQEFGIDAQAGLGDMDYPLRTNFINTFGLVQLDKKRVMHFIYDRTNGKINPYGYPELRKAYNLWLRKTLIQRLYDSAMGRVANPAIVVYADATKVINTPVGTEQINAVDAAYHTMQHYTEESAIILPGRKGEMFEIEVVHSEGNFGIYENALSYVDGALEKCMFNPEGLFSDSSFSGATAQNSMYVRAMSSIGKEVKYCVLQQYVKYLIHKNFGEHIHDYGSFESDLQNIDDKLKYEKLFEGMTANGYLSNTDESDIQRIRKTLGQPELGADALKELIARNKLIDVPKTMDNSNKTNTKEVANHYKNRSTNENV